MDPYRALQLVLRTRLRHAFWAWGRHLGKHILDKNAADPLPVPNIHARTVSDTFSVENSRHEVSHAPHYQRRPVFSSL